MLRELSVQNLALIEDARIELRPGYCAWTGETGAGKSLLLTALGLVLGGKASADLVRAGKDEARAAAVFDVSDPGLRADLEAILGGPIDDDQLILTRRVSAQGRSASHANGLPVTVATLQALGDRLIDVHGQHESRALLDPDRQRGPARRLRRRSSPLLDAYREARDAHAALLARRSALIRDVAGPRARAGPARLRARRAGRRRPPPGEHDDLAREAHRLANAEAVRSAALEGFALLYESDRSAQGLLEKVARKLAPLADAVPEFADAAADLDRLADEAREVAYALRRFGQGWEDDPARLDEVEARLALYRRLAARFRCEPDDLAARRARDRGQARRDRRRRRRPARPSTPPWPPPGPRSAAAPRPLRSRGRRRARRSPRRSRPSSRGSGSTRPGLTVEVESDPLGDDPAARPPPRAGVDRVEIVFAPNPGEAPGPSARSPRAASCRG